MIVRCDNLYGISSSYNGQEEITWENGTVEYYASPAPFELVLPCTEVYQRDGVQYREQAVPVGWIVIDTFIPHSVPWDVCGMRHALDVWGTLLSNNIPALICNILERSLSPRGSGPGGSVRMGDDMLPGVYRVAVPRHCAQAARETLK